MRGTQLLLLALKMERGAVNQGTYMAPSRWKDPHATVRRKQGYQSDNHKELTSTNNPDELESRSSPRASRKKQPADTQILAQ